MKKRDSKFQTHIPEPRWQQVVSILIVILSIVAFIWGWVVRHSHK